jgi:hypothetical protein
MPKPDLSIDMELIENMQEKPRLFKRMAGSPIKSNKTDKKTNKSDKTNKPDKTNKNPLNKQNNFTNEFNFENNLFENIYNHQTKKRKRANSA